MYVPEVSSGEVDYRTNASLQRSEKWEVPMISIDFAFKFLETVQTLQLPERRL